MTRHAPSRLQLEHRRRRRIVDAALRLEVAHVAARQVLGTFVRGTPERRRALRARLEAGKRLRYHVREFRREERERVEAARADATYSAAVPAEPVLDAAAVQ